MLEHLQEPEGNSVCKTPHTWWPSFCLYICLFWVFHKWNYTCGLLCLASFTQHVFKVYPQVICLSISLPLKAKKHSVIWIYHIILYQLMNFSAVSTQKISDVFSRHRSFGSTYPSLPPKTLTLLLTGALHQRKRQPSSFSSLQQTNSTDSNGVVVFHILQCQTFIVQFC